MYIYSLFNSFKEQTNHSKDNPQVMSPSSILFCLMTAMYPYPPMRLPFDRLPNTLSFSSICVNLKQNCETVFVFSYYKPHLFRGQSVNPSPKLCKEPHASASLTKLDQVHGSTKLACPRTNQPTNQPVS